MVRKIEILNVRVRVHFRAFVEQLYLSMIVLKQFNRRSTNSKFLKRWLQLYTIRLLFSCYSILQTSSCVDISKARIPLAASRASVKVDGWPIR